MASVVRVIPEDLYQRLLSSGSLEIELLKDNIDIEGEKVEETNIVQSGDGVNRQTCHNLIRFEDKFELK